MAQLIGLQQERVQKLRVCSLCLTPHQHLDRRLRLMVYMDSNLTEATDQTYHQMPIVEETTHRMEGATVFSKLDAKYGYWSIELDEASSEVTLFKHTKWKMLF